MREITSQGDDVFGKSGALVYYYIVINVMEAIIFFGFGINPQFELFYVSQLLLLLVTSHTFPGFALVFDKKNDSIMKEKPRDSEEILTRPIYVILIFHAIIMSVCVLA